jgi:hypothetical protein
MEPYIIDYARKYLVVSFVVHFFVAVVTLHFKKDVTRRSQKVSGSQAKKLGTKQFLSSLCVDSSVSSVVSVFVKSNAETTEITEVLTAEAEGYSLNIGALLNCNRKTLNRKCKSCYECANTFSPPFTKLNSTSFFISI